MSAAVERLVAGGRLAAGTRLPTVRELAATLELSPTTVAATYRSLGQRGVVRADGRRGTSIASGPPLPVATDRPLPEGALDLRFGNPDAALMPSLRAHLRRLADDTKGYGEPATLPELDAAARSQLRADGIPAERVIAVSGALDGVERVLLAWLRPGDRVAVEDPGFPRVFDLVAALGLTAVPVAVDARGPVPESFAAALARGVDACIVTPRAQNPTGAALDPARTPRAAAAPAWASRRARGRGRPRRTGGGRAGAHAGDGEAGALGRRAIGGQVARPRFAARAARGGSGDARSRRGPAAPRPRLGEPPAPAARRRPVVGRRGREATHRATAVYRARRNALVDTLAMHGIDVETPSGLNVWVPVPDEATALQVLEDAGYTVAPGARFRIASPPAVRVTVAALPERVAPAVAKAVAAACAPARNVTAPS